MKFINRPWLFAASSLVCCLLIVPYVGKTNSQLPAPGHAMNTETLHLPSDDVRALVMACALFSAQSHHTCSSATLRDYDVRISEFPKRYFVTFNKKRPNNTLIGTISSDYAYEVDKSTFLVKRVFPM